MCFLGSKVKGRDKWSRKKDKKFEISEKDMDIMNNLNDDTCMYKKYL